MEQLNARFIVTLTVALGTASLADAEILIGVPAPMTGGMSWIGEQGERGTALAVADLNAAGGVLGEQVRAVVVDDFCEADQAVAAAKSWSPRASYWWQDISVLAPPSRH